MDRGVLEGYGPPGRKESDMTECRTLPHFKDVFYMYPEASVMSDSL